MQSFERQPRAWAGLVDELYLSDETRLSKLGEKATQRGKESKETRKYVPNRIIR